jgi:hypothetical protein
MADNMFAQIQAEMEQKKAATAAAREALRIAEKDEAACVQKLVVYAAGGKRAQGAAPKSKGITKKTPNGSGKNPNRAKQGTHPGEKKPPSPYMLFCKEQRPNVLKENPGIDFADVGRALGAAWRKLSDAQKAAYKQDIAPLPAVPQSSGAGGAAQADAQMSESKSEDSEDSEDIEYDSDVEFDDVYFEDLVVRLGNTYPFFNEGELDPLPKLYLEQLSFSWLYYSEYKCDIFLKMTQKKVKNMQELNALIKKTFYPYLSEPCYNEDLPEGKNWHTYVVDAFHKWNQQHPRFIVSLDKFYDHSGLHLLTLKDFKKVEQKMNEKMTVKPFETWIAFATALLTECTEHRGPFDHDDHLRIDDYDFTCDFNTIEGFKIDHRSLHLHHLMHS